MNYFLVLVHIRANSGAQHPNHTWQSWRDRYIKTLDKRPEEWKQNFTSQAQVLLGGSNGQGKTVTTSTSTKRARSNEPGNQHNTPSTKKQRVNDSSRDDTEEEPAGDTNISGSLQAQARGNTQPDTTPPIEAPRCPSPSSQLIAEQEETGQTFSFRAQDVPPSQPNDRSSPPQVIDLTNESLEGSGSASSDEDDMDDFLIPEPEGGFAPETQFPTQTQNQIQIQHPSSPPSSSGNPDEPLSSSEESERTLDPERALDPPDHTQNDDDESDKDEEAELDFHTLYAFYKNRGYSDARIATALHATSANPDVLELVLEELEAGRGVPQDVRGVWTEDDDTFLMSFKDYLGENVVTKSSVMRKHGLMRCEWRKAFLERMKLESGALR